jgi:methylated-DNA-[protein]-cysteine S-methyltransferase
MIELSRFDSPVGILTVAIGPRGLRALALGGRMPKLLPSPTRETTTPPDIAAALSAYFAGDLRAIDAVAIDPEGTPFQRRVWAALRTIPAGTTWSYAELARAVGQPTATRAVGAANGRNPIALVVPCHRVIASDGTLGGYGGGLEMKRWLLRHERSWPAAAQLPFS